MQTMSIQAQAIADRVGNKVKFDPITILTIISSLLPMLSKCATKSDQPDPAQMKATITEQFESHPKVLLKRTANAYFREQKKAGVRLTHDEAMEFAKATIAQVVDGSVSSQVVAAVCCECAA